MIPSPEPLCDTTPLGHSQTLNPTATQISQPQTIHPTATPDTKPEAPTAVNGEDLRAMTDPLPLPDKLSGVRSRVLGSPGTVLHLSVLRS